MNLNATLIIEVLSFLILVGLLVRFLYRPVLNILDKRARQIQEESEKIQQNLEHAEEERSKAEKILAESKGEALKLKEQVNLDAERARQKILNAAKQEASKVIRAAGQEIAKEAQRAKDKIKAEVVDLSIQAAEQVLRREISPKDQKRLIKELTERVK